MSTTTKWALAVIVAVVIGGGIVVLLGYSASTPVPTPQPSVVQQPRATPPHNTQPNQNVYSNEWWIGEYPTLLDKVNQTKDKSLSLTYKTGPEGKQTVNLSLNLTDKGLVLDEILPKEAIFTIDEKTGKKQYEGNSEIFIRDYNLDGTADDFKMKRAGSYEGETTTDGFAKIKNTEEFKIFYTQWSIGIGYFINYFLHGVNSPLNLRK